MNTSRIIFLALLAALAPAASADPGDTADGLTCRIEVSSDVQNAFVDVPARLVLKNTSEKPIRVCTQCQAWRGSGAGFFEVEFTPERFKSDAPSAEDLPGYLAQHITTLQPGESVSIPFEIIAVEGAKAKTTVTASYGMSEAMGKKIGVWHGAIGAKFNFQRP